jgi:hypothetical protein
MVETLEVRLKTFGKRSPELSDNDWLNRTEVVKRNSPLVSGYRSTYRPKPQIVNGPAVRREKTKLGSPDRTRPRDRDVGEPAAEIQTFLDDPSWDRWVKEIQKARSIANSDQFLSPVCYLVTPSQRSD